MKTLIDNRTDLCFEDIGTIIDYIQEREKNTTQYIGKWKGYKLAYKNKNIAIETMIMKRFLKIIIREEREQHE